MTCKNPCCSSLSLPLSSKPSPYAHLLHQAVNRNPAACDDQAIRSSIRDFIGALESELGTCDEQISYVETILSSLRAQRDKIADSIREHRAVVGAVHDIPTEILLKIFDYYLDDCNGCDASIYGGRSGPGTLADVCKRWKEVAEATPSLWANLTLPSAWSWLFDRRSLVKRAIRCSASNLLTLSIDLTNKFYGKANPLPLLSSQSARWRALHMTTTDSGLQQMRSLTQLDELQEVWLSLTGKPNRTADIARALRIFNHASIPKVHLLRIDSETIEPENAQEDYGGSETFFLRFDPLQSPNFPFASLTHVDIQASFGDSGGLMALLALCTNIQDLNLIKSAEQVDDEHSTNHIVLNCLTTLVVDEMDWVLPCITCPRIHNMTVTAAASDHILQFLRNNQNIDLDSATFTAVNTHPDHGHDWMEILRLLPTVRSLTFEFLLGTSTAMDAVDSDHVPSRVFNTLSGRADACSLLKELNVIFVPGNYDLDTRPPFNLDGNGLDSVLQSRKTTLSKVSVCCEGWADDSWEQVIMISALREEAVRSSLYEMLAGLRDQVEVVFMSTVSAGLGLPDIEDDYFEIPTELKPSSEEEISEE
ncbi:hypothetical protein CYLTODRAFT_447509 [Cylindrobasidium torrendii FP15055 ss-10]|uniref:F-box domain-containing protein n=1 Tax=Cylindrobasidium torrendii FP15055 ss-10 TaxID=1314674 RepID=A0A0D7AX32_9AGAR|nr:hypothetical protein CYLTODRAFT_447509 [Cylindrobasidium torrendii FP15055 ss-10]